MGVFFHLHPFQRLVKGCGRIITDHPKLFLCHSRRSQQQQCQQGQTEQPYFRFHLYFYHHYPLESCCYFYYYTTNIENAQSLVYSILGSIHFTTQLAESVTNESSSTVALPLVIHKSAWQYPMKIPSFLGLVMAYQLFIL